MIAEVGEALAAREWTELFAPEADLSALCIIVNLHRFGLARAALL